MGSINFSDFINSPDVTVSLARFVINLLLAAALAFALGYIYVYYGKSLSNRRHFANNFVLLTMTTVVIITVVKSSLALSLGLVGALSIVRFRAAIKEPEELAYLFLAIAVGLGFGAGQTFITLVGFALIIIMILIRAFKTKKREDTTLFYLRVSTPRDKGIELKQIVEIIKKYCHIVYLKRFDDSKDCNESSFLVGCESFDKISQLKNDLCGSGDNVEVTFFDYKNFC